MMSAGDHLPEITEDVFEASVLEFFKTDVQTLIGLSKVPRRSIGAIQPSNLAASRSEGKDPADAAMRSRSEVCLLSVIRHGVSCSKKQRRKSSWTSVRCGKKFMDPNKRK
jgi:hypothetical protein